jgi:hypothetical protein
MFVPNDLRPSFGTFFRTIVLQSIMWACWAFFAYAFFVHERGPMPPKAWGFMGVITGGVVLATLFGGTRVFYGEGKTFWGLIDVITWIRQRRTRVRTESGHCIHCGYPIASGPQLLCPECGRRPR